MKKILLFVVTLFFVFGGTSLAVGEPFITSITPSIISPGDTITINGGNFNSSWRFTHFQRNSSGLGYVSGYAYINDSCGVSYVNASIPEVSNSNVISWSDSQIILKVPLNYFSSLYADPSCYDNKAVNLKIEIPTVFGRAPICEVDSCAQKCTTDTCYREVSYNTAQPSSYLSGSFFLKDHCAQDIWDCGSWSSCSLYGNQSRACTKALDCPAVDTPSPETTQSCTPECTADTWSCGSWAGCQSNGTQTRTCTRTYDCPLTNDPSPATTQSCTYVPTCTADTWICNDWNSCSIDGSQTRSCYMSLDCPGITTPPPITTQACTPACISDTWTCESWSTCSRSGSQNRTCTKTNDCSLIDTPSPATTQSCSPACDADDYTCGVWGACNPSGKQTRVCNKNSDICTGTYEPVIIQNCTYIPPTCTSWTYSEWSTCSSNGTQTRTIISSLPNGCVGGGPILSQNCTYMPPCTSSDWSCGGWSACSANRTQSRTCNKISNCEGGVASPITTQSCSYIPSCTADEWTCSYWGECSISGIQSRTCTKTYDCPNVQTAPPITDRYCTPPNRPPQPPPDESIEVVNQDKILKATVKLICPVDAQSASQGSGTIINAIGIILTNKHVISETVGCYVGFINNFDDEPYGWFVADVVKTSPDKDIALLKIRNSGNINFTPIDITRGNISIALGEKILTYGYPAAFGKKLTYTSGDFSGIDDSGDYFKTTAILEHGSSGGGAYLKNGKFIGIPSGGYVGEDNTMGLILSMNVINNWFNNLGALSSIPININSKFSALENMDANKLKSLKLFIAKTDKKGELITSPKEQITGKVVEQPKAIQVQEKTEEQTQQAQPMKESIVKESIVIESKDLDKEFSDQRTPPRMEQSKLSWFSRLASWITGSPVPIISTTTTPTLTASTTHTEPPVVKKSVWSRFWSWFGF